jgi:hypothetical protein
MGFFTQLFTSIAGGGMGGFFVVVGVNIQARRQEDAALRTLLVEVQWNATASDRMVDQIMDPANAGYFNDGEPDPSYLRRSIWDSQLVNVVNALDVETLTNLMNAYATIEAVPGMRLSPPGSSPNFRRYARGGWIDEKVKAMKTFFNLAGESLRSVIDRRRAETLYVKIRKAASFE